jgi:PAS domain S-box-containing protein
MAIDIGGEITKFQRIALVSGCVAAVFVFIVVEKLLGPAMPLGGMFLLPILVAAVCLPRSVTFIFAIAVALAREYFETPSWQVASMTRLALGLVAYTGAGLFAGELVRNRRLSLESARKSAREMSLREEAEREARALMEASPAAVITLDSNCVIAKSNQAASRLLGFASGSPEGESVENYVPTLATLLRSKRVGQFMRNGIETRGRRRDGQALYLQAWVYRYSSVSGPRLSAILLDVTEQVRDRAELGLQQLLTNSRIIAGAVSHELRNLAAAAAVLHLNMHEFPGIVDNADYKALGTVVDSMQKLSSAELSDTSDSGIEDRVDIAALLQELNTVIAPKFDDAAVGLDWEIASGLPQVRASRSGLLQVLLNLAENSCRVLEGRPDGRLAITAYSLPDSALIKFSDNGPGISSAERLFQPFHPGASSTGLGLFVSRAIIRTFGGELHHTQRPGECSFVIELLPAARGEE